MAGSVAKVTVNNRSRRARVHWVRTFRRIHVSRVCASSEAARGARSAIVLAVGFLIGAHAETCRDMDDGCAAFIGGLVSDPNLAIPQFDRE